VSKADTSHSIDRVTAEQSMKAPPWYRIRFYLLILPTFAVIGLFSYYPSFSAIYHSFFRWNGSNINEFVGFGNFVRMFLTDKALLVSVWHMLLLVLAGLITQIPSVILAVVMYHLRNKRLQYMFRVIFVIPMVVPGMVGMLLWMFIYNPQVGLLNRVLTVVGIIPMPLAGPTWLADSTLALPSLMFMGFPYINPIGLLIYLAGLERIPTSLTDAAMIDGASWYQRFMRVEIPMILGQIKLMLILSIIGGVQDYGRVLIMTGGGPHSATTVPGMEMYNRAFRYAQMGYASAIGVVMFLVILGLTIINMKYFKTHDEE
jgi:raffinose/stachyose/melibiose transport system permease protein